MFLCRPIHENDLDSSDAGIESTLPDQNSLDSGKLLMAHFGEFIHLGRYSFPLTNTGVQCFFL